MRMHTLHAHRHEARTALGVDALDNAAVRHGRAILVVEDGEARPAGLLARQAVQPHRQRLLAALAAAIPLPPLLSLAARTRRGARRAAAAALAATALAAAALAALAALAAALAAAALAPRAW